MTTIQLRRDTAANWSTANPVLSSGEAGYDTTNKLLKIGDGSTAWNNLEALPAPSEITELGNELNQLASSVTGLETSKQDTLTAGDNITIVDNVISATASGGSSNYEDLTNKPQINSVELNGNVSLASLDVYNKDEVDGQLLLKENKITPVSPIGLSYYVKSNLEGFTYTTGGNGVYSTDGVGYYLGTASQPVNQATIAIGIGTDSFEGATGFNPKSYIDVPYTIGQTLLTPPGISFIGNRSLPVVFGKVLQNGDFIPICFMGTTNSTSPLTITTSDTPQTATANRLRFPYASITGSIQDWGNRTNAPTLFGLARIFKSSDTTYYVDYDARQAQSGSSVDLYSVRFIITDLTQIARLEEITTARIFSNAASESSSNYGVNADSPIYINTIGLYNDLPINGNIDFNTLTNLFEIGKETAYNYLELNLSAEEGNTLEVKSDGLYVANYSFSPADLDKINQSKALTTGAVSTDADVFADIQMYAHSTFDKSKFEVVGSPSITDDGIASGFSDGNYLKVDNITLGNDFEIDYVINLPTLINNNFILSGEDGNYIQLSVTSTGSLQTDLGNGTSWIANANHNTQIEANTDTALKIKYTNNTLNVYKNGNLIDSTEVTGLNIPACNLLIGTNRAKAIFTNGSIFLKSFKAKANGVVIFTGNQTGLDIIKPDDYTVVGTPTITADGVASGFSDGNYLKMPNLPIIKDNITMTCNVNIGVIGTVAFNYIMGWYTNESSSYLRFVYQNEKINIQWKDKDLTSGQAESNNVDSNSQHLLKFELTESNLKCYLDNVLFANVDVEINLDALTPDVFTIGRMNNVGTWILNQGSIDLNSFKVYVDGSLVYQPCLKIPYTLSKTGSKIVDAAYRDRVKDVYEQYGTAMYYTIDEENQNFTLPMGEIYGMIGQKDKESSYILPTASTTTLGGVKIDGTTITIADGVISAALEGYAQTSDIPTATSDLTNDSGFITNSVNNLTNYTLTSGLAAVATSGSYNDLSDKPTIPSEYVLPTASASVLGGIKIGDGVAVTDDGTISVASVDGFKFWSGTQTAYNGIATKDPNTLYIITG